MDLVNSIGGSLAGHRQNAAAVASSFFSDNNAGSQSDSGPSKAIIKAGDVSSNLLEIFKSTLFEAESYLTFFETRVKLEEDYIRGLKMMTDKSRDTIVKLDSRLASSLSFETGTSELPKARLAWREIRDNHLREMEARLNYVETIKQGVISPLIVYRDSQERIRKRVKDDLKTSISAYDEMRQSTLPRAKKTYDKRCEEVEQLRLQQVAVEDQRLLLSQAALQQEGSQGSHGDDNPNSHSLPSQKSDVDEEHLTSEGEINAPTITRRSLSFKSKSLAKATSDGGESNSGQSNASPRLGAESGLSTSPPSQEKRGHFLEALRSRETWETARKEGPKKLNALLNRMRDGGNDKNESNNSVQNFESNVGSPPSLGVTLGNGPGSFKSSQHLALKHVKAKRESEEADKAYRKAIFDVETLRMRRHRTLEAAKSSVIESRRELYLTCQAVWMQAEKSIQTLANNQVSLSAHSEDLLRGSLDNLGDELGKLQERIVLPEEARVPYVNYYFGECKDLLFGVSLLDYAFNRAQQAPPHLGPPTAEAPLIVQKCIRYVEEKAIDQPGIYRTSAKHTAVQNLAHALERDETRFAFDATDDEPSVVAGVFKLYLRQLPDPVLPMPWEERVRYTHERDEQIQTGFASLKGRIRRLPAINQATLKAIIEHLAKIASHSDKNLMTPSNLSIIFGPLLLSQADHEATSIAAAMEEDRVTEDLILYADTIFDLTRAGAPVLPTLPPRTKHTFDFDTEKEVKELEPSLAVTGINSPEGAPLSQSVQASTQSESVIVPDNQLAKNFDETEVNQNHSYVPRTAADAYLPPQESSIPSIRMENEWNDESSEPEVESMQSERTAIQESNGVVAPSSKQKPSIVTDLNEDHLSTSGQTISATPMTAVSSANASLGHTEEED